MKYISVVLFSLTTLIAVPSFALGSCNGSKSIDWDNCIGTEIYDDGSKYVGEYRNGMRNGQGNYTWPNGNTYMGEFKDGTLNGMGINTYKNGSKYVGEYKNGRRNGQGTFIDSNGTKYIGEFKDGKENGHGTLIYTSGNKYVGEFKDRYPHGQGTLTYSDGTKESGLWKNGEFKGYKEENPNNKQTAKVKTKTCKNNFYKCTNVELCVRSTAMVSGNVRWSQVFDNSDYVYEAIRRGLDCGVRNSQTNTYVRDTNPIIKKERSEFSKVMEAIFMGLATTGSNQTYTRKLKPTVGFLKSQYTSGFNKICIYSSTRGDRSITIKSTQMCPFSN